MSFFPLTDSDIDNTDHFHVHAMHADREGMATENRHLNAQISVLETVPAFYAARSKEATMKQMTLSYRLGVEHGLWQWLQEAGVRPHQPTWRGRGRGGRGSRLQRLGSQTRTEVLEAENQEIHLQAVQAGLMAISSSE